MQGNRSSSLRVGLIFSFVGMALGLLVVFTNHNTLPKTLGGVAFCCRDCLGDFIRRRDQSLWRAASGLVALAGLCSS